MEGGLLLTRRILISALAVAACAVPASATISYYSDPTLFSNAVSGATAQSIDFGSAGQFFSNSDTIDGVTFTGIDAGFPGPSGDLTVLAQPNGSWPTGTVLARSTGSFSYSGGSITISLPSAVEGISFYISYARGSIGGSNPLGIAVAGDSPTSSLIVSSLNTPYFVGLVASGGSLGVVTLTAGDYTNQIELGGFSFDTGSSGSDSSTPELGSFFLIGTGLILFPVFRRRFVLRSGT
jgi:hypothetical protein